MGFSLPIILIPILLSSVIKLEEQTVLTKNSNNNFEKIVTNVYWEQLEYNENLNVIYGEFTLEGFPNEEIEVVHLDSSQTITETFTPQFQDGLYSFTKAPYYDAPINEDFYELETFEVYDGNIMLDSRNASITNFDVSPLVTDMMITHTSTTFLILEFEHDLFTLQRADEIGYTYQIYVYYESNAEIAGIYDVTSDEIQNDKILDGLQSEVPYVAEFYSIENNTGDKFPHDSIEFVLQ